MRWLALVCAFGCLALSGCVTTSVPAGLSDDEVSAYVALEREKLWQQTNLDASQRPAVGDPDFVSWSYYQQHYVDCMNSTDTRGLRFELTQSSDVSVIFPEGAGYDDQYLLSDYLCRARVLLSPAQAGYFSTGQLNAIYDYYQEELIPCLALRGHPINGPHPRADFVDGPDYVLWSPYSDLNYDTITSAGLDELVASCPQYPPFMTELVG
jgi:hypothetical protein